MYYPQARWFAVAGSLVAAALLLVSGYAVRRTIDLLGIRPEMMADGLLLSIPWSGWIVVGALLEERDLVADFGDVYRRYQRRVPMLVPWRGPVSVAAGRKHAGSLRVVSALAPVAVPGLEGITQVAVGPSHNLSKHLNVPTLLDLR